MFIEVIANLDQLAFGKTISKNVRLKRRTKGAEGEIRCNVVEIH